MLFNIYLPIYYTLTVIHSILFIYHILTVLSFYILYLLMHPNIVFSLFLFILSTFLFLTVHYLFHISCLHFLILSLFTHKLLYLLSYHSHFIYHAYIVAVLYIFLILYNSSILNCDLIHIIYIYSFNCSHSFSLIYLIPSSLYYFIFILIILFIYIYNLISHFYPINITCYPYFS